MHNFSGIAGNQAKVPNFDAPIQREEYVGGLEVPVDHPATVDVLNSIQYL